MVCNLNLEISDIKLVIYYCSFEVEVCLAGDVRRDVVMDVTSMCMCLLLVHVYF
jgi:hypothetical protein